MTITKEYASAAVVVRSRRMIFVAPPTPSPPWIILCVPTTYSSFVLSVLRLFRNKKIIGLLKMPTNAADVVRKQNHVNSFSALHVLACSGYPTSGGSLCPKSC